MPAPRHHSRIGGPRLAWLVHALWVLLMWMGGEAFASSQDPTGRLLFQSYGREVGLGSLRINLLLQDTRGFIWAGTDRGLYRFDGQRFQAFGTAQGLPSLEVNAMALDARGVLWVGSSGGLSRWTGQRFAAAPSVPASTAVADLSLGPGGLLWAATPQGMWRQTSTGWALVPGPGPGNPEALAYASPTPGQLTPTPVWAATRQRLWTWRDAEGWREAAVQVSLSRGERLDRLAVAGDGSLLVRSSRATYRLAPGAVAFERLDAVPRAEVFLSRMTNDADGGLWLPTERGLSRWHEGRLTHWGLSDGLPTEFARAVLVDREGGLWVGSLGLHRLLGLGAWRTHTAKQGLPADVWAILRDRDARLWVGTGKGLARSEGPNGWRVLPGTEGHAVRAVVQDTEGRLLFGGEPMDLMQWDPNLRRLTTLTGLPEAGRKVMALAIDREGTLWVGTQRAGLLRGRQSANGWEFVREALPGGQATDRVNDLHLDRQGRLWVATNKGLMRLQDEVWQRYGRPEGLLSDNLVYLGAGERGTDLWLAYRDIPGAVTQWALGDQGGQVRRHLRPPQLPAQDITLVGEDADGRLWVGGSQGLEMLSAPRRQDPSPPTHFGVERGLVDEEINARALRADADGTLWFGTRGGLAQFDSRRFEGDPQQLSVVLLEARLGEREWPLEAGVQGGEPWRVTHRDNVLQATFASLSFTDPAGLSFQARLVGLEQDWHDAPTRELRYAGLAPGPYRLELRTRYRQGEWGPVTALDFQVQPPWWQTPWFRVGLALASVLAVLAWRQRQLRRHRRETARLQALVAERTEALAQANAALREQSLTDPLTGLHNRRFMEEAMGEHVALAQRQRAAAGDPPFGLVLLLLDIDRFKAVNDVHGHGAGDAVLVQMAQRLRACTRESDVLVRWGGEEFAIAAHANGLSQGAQLAERIRASVEGVPFELGGAESLSVTCSVGFVPFPWGEGALAAVPWQRLMAVADACLYCAKRSGRNRWVGVQPASGLSPEAHALLLDSVGGSLAPLVAQDMLDVQALGPAPLDWT